MLLIWVTCESKHCAHGELPLPMDQEPGRAGCKCHLSKSGQRETGTFKTRLAVPWSTVKANQRGRSVPRRLVPAAQSTHAPRGTCVSDLPVSGSSRVNEKHWVSENHRNEVKKV